MAAASASAVAVGSRTDAYGGERVNTRTKRMLRAADLTPELVDAATEALLMSHRKFSETRLEAMRFTGTAARLARRPCGAAWTTCGC